MDGPGPRGARRCRRRVVAGGVDRRALGGSVPGERAVRDASEPAVDPAAPGSAAKTRSSVPANAATCARTCRPWDRDRRIRMPLSHPVATGSRSAVAQPWARIDTRSIRRWPGLPVPSGSRPVQRMEDAASRRSPPGSARQQRLSGLLPARAQGHRRNDGSDPPAARAAQGPRGFHADWDYTLRPERHANGQLAYTASSRAPTVPSQSPSGA